MQAPNLGAAGQQQAANLAGLAGLVQLRLPNGQYVMLQQQAVMNNPALHQLLLQQQQQQLQLLGAGRGLPLNVQQLLQGQQPGAQNALVAAANAQQQAQQRQAQLLALQRQQQAAAQLQPAGAAAAAAAAAVRPQQPAAAAQQARAVTTAGFTNEQLDTLTKQIMVFKKYKKGAEQVSADELAACKPKPLVQSLQHRGPGVVLPPAAVAAAPGAAAAGIRPANAAALPLQGIRPAQLANNMAALGGAHQQLRPTGSLGRGAGSAGGAAGRGVQAPGRPAGEGAAAAPKEPPPGPSHPPMEAPVRRPAGPVLSMHPPIENAPREHALCWPGLLCGRSCLACLSPCTYTCTDGCGATAQSPPKSVTLACVESDVP